MLFSVDALNLPKNFRMFVAGVNIEIYLKDLMALMSILYAIIALCYFIVF